MSFTDTLEVYISLFRTVLKEKGAHIKFVGTILTATLAVYLANSSYQNDSIRLHDHGILSSESYFPECYLHYHTSQDHYMDIEDVEEYPKNDDGPKETLFLVVGGSRTGTQWIMNGLASHDKICAPGEKNRSRIAFPADELFPGNVTWMPECAIRKGCHFSFIRDGVLDLTANGTDAQPKRCLPNYIQHPKWRDPYKHHLNRLCNFVKVLDGDFRIDSITSKWIEAFVYGDRSLLACECAPDVEAKGIKILSDWLLYQNYPYDYHGPADVNLNDTLLDHRKVIRIKRPNLWARFKSLAKAWKTDMYHIKTHRQHDQELHRIKRKKLKIDVVQMKWTFHDFIFADEAGDRWVQEHASEVLWIDYDECNADPEKCFDDMFEFIGVDPPIKESKLYKAALQPFEEDVGLDFVKNKEEILLMLGANGWGHFIERDDIGILLHLFVYDPDEMIELTREQEGIGRKVYGNDPTEEGYGAMMSAVLPFLQNLDPDEVVILSSSRDFWINFQIGDYYHHFLELRQFKIDFKDMTKRYPGSVVVSTDRDCCATALTHARPGDYFKNNGLRDHRACQSGESDCLWASDENANTWKREMEELAAKKKTKSKSIYLDASILVGTASDLINMIHAVDIAKGEDHRAVLTDYMLRHPDKILLDYDHKLTGISRLKEGVVRNVGCPETAVVTTAQQLDHTPLFHHNPAPLGCEGQKKQLPPVYPRWNDGGIELDPVLDHVQRVKDELVTLVIPTEWGYDTPDYNQGAETPYVIDATGIWTSQTIRDKTNNETMFWRQSPTEKMLYLEAYKILMQHEDESRWKLVKKTVKEDSGFLFWGYYGDFKACNHLNYKNTSSIPLFTTAARQDCIDAFPIPNYMMFFDSQHSQDSWVYIFGEYERDYPWESKKRQVVWRGALSEARTEETLKSIRWRVAKYVYENPSDLYDIGITSIPKWITDVIDIDTSEIGGFVEGIYPMKSFMDYQAILDMDGNSWSSRFSSLLCYNSVIIKAEPKYVAYFNSDLKPWTHYIPVKDDLSDFEENIAWALDPKNEQAVKDIIFSANQFCAERLIFDTMAKDLVDSWEAYVRRLYQADPQWEEKWASRKDNMMKNPEFQFFQL